LGGNQCELSCHGNGVCYETDNTGTVAPGHDILIHYGDITIIAIIQSASEGTGKPPTTPKSDPTDQLPSKAIVEISK